MPVIENEIGALPLDAVHLCDIGAIKYHSIPAKGVESAKLIEENKGKLTEINAANRADYPQVVATVKAASSQCAAINAQVVAKIRERYSVDDEIQMLRIAPSAESALWNDYVETCRAWGHEQKAALGL
jgi:hypothetical protein